MISTDRITITALDIARDFCSIFGTEVTKVGVQDGGPFDRIKIRTPLHRATADSGAEHSGSRVTKTKYKAVPGET